MINSTQTIHANRTALLIMDYQHGILAALPDASVAVERAAQAIEIVRRAGGHVGHVRVAFTETELQQIPDRNKAFSAARPGA